MTSNLIPVVNIAYISLYSVFYVFWIFIFIKAIQLDLHICALFTVVIMFAQGYVIYLQHFS